MNLNDGQGGDGLSRTDAEDSTFRRTEHIAFSSRIAPPPVQQLAVEFGILFG
jgi:hypothetical protein